MKIETLSKIIVGGVLGAVVLYAGTLLFLIWPITELSLDRSGLFGDSFGLLTSLFSGLAFSGMLIAVLLQKEELGLQRKELQENRIEFKKSAEAQELNVKLNALTSLLNEYKDQIRSNDLALNNYADESFAAPSTAEHALMQENSDLYRRKNLILTEIETLLEKSGVVLSKIK